MNEALLGTHAPADDRLGDTVAAADISHLGRHVHALEQRIERALEAPDMGPDLLDRMIPVVAIVDPKPKI